MPLLSAERRRSAAFRPVALGSVLALTAGLLVALAPAASAEDSMTDLGVAASAGDLVVGGGKIAVAAGDRIVVADTTGKLTGTVTGLSDVHSLVMTDDGNRLYAALTGSNEVAEIDTATLEITRRIDLAAYPCPTSLALTGKRLWVGHDCSADGVLSLDLSVATPEPSPFETPLKAGPRIAAAGNTLVVGEGAGSPADLFVYDVSGPAPVLRGEIDGHKYDNYSLKDVTVTPDGSHAISAFALPYSFDMWDTTTLAKVRGYEGPQFDGWPSAVAISPDGAYIAGARDTGVAMTVYDAASGAKVFAEDTSTGEVVGGSVAFSGRDVFSLVKSSADKLYLWRLHDVTLPASTLTLTAAPGGTAHAPLTMTGHLAFAGGTAPGAQPLTVTRTLPDGTSAELPGVTTATDGAFTVTDEPPVGGQITYTVRWKGDGEHRWSRASVTTAVRYGTAVTLTGPEILDKTLVFRGVLRFEGIPLPRNLRVIVERTLNADAGSTRWWSAAVRSDGSYMFADTPDAGEYTYTVRWAGDGRTGPAQASQVVTVHEPNG
ncbi:WD40 repeat domain-containing protein [Nonomuraea sp. NPDC050691]|uniref:WD40 repeat domain-containing protein n=1 Tax=Nonomuraea sp. NPDC050691 TaxID=3155661 RepID=UPI0033F72235